MIVEHNGEYIQSVMKGDPLTEAIDAMSIEDYIIWTVMLSRRESNVQL